MPAPDPDTCEDCPSGVNCATCNANVCLTCDNNWIPSQTEKKCICPIANCDECLLADGTTCTACANGYYKVLGDK